MDYALARRNMVEGQLRPNRVTDPAVIEAIGAVPRERFVPTPMAGIAYVDEDLPVGKGRCLMEPRVFGRLVQAADVGADNVVLVIGSGTGYAAVVLAQLASTVVALESDTEMAEAANALLTELSVDNAAVVQGPLVDGYPRQAPYDVIFFDGAIDAVPESVIAQLAEGGRLVGVIAAGQDGGRARLIQRMDGVLGDRELFDASVPFLPELQPKSRFVF
jgi:protein-L-isoaspartate(D-aspartate) O-methyltransferase